MTNAEKFKTVEERQSKFNEFCKQYKRCHYCPLWHPARLGICRFKWLDLEDKEELKPCPFCGHTDIRMRQNKTKDVWYVFCNGCGCHTGGSVLKDMAIAAWNRRAK